MASTTSFANPQIIPHLEAEADITLFDCLWVPCSARFVVLGAKLSGEGVLRTYAMGNSELRQLGQAERPRALKCGTFGASSLEDRHLATGDFDGYVQMWDLQHLDEPVFSVRGHDGRINAIDGLGGLGSVGRGAPEIATASSDGTVKVWDPRIRDRPVACVQPKEGEGKRDAWAVAFGNSHNEQDRMLVAGYDNGDVKMFDLRSMSLVWEQQVANGVCSVQFDRGDIDMNKLLATGLEGRFHVWDLRTRHPAKGFAELNRKHEKGTIWRGKHLPQNRDVFMTGGGSGELALWQYRYPEKRVKKDKGGVEEGVPGTVELLQETQVGDQPISSFDWSPDKSGLGLAVSFDQKIRVIIVTKLNTL